MWSVPGVTLGSGGWSAPLLSFDRTNAGHVAAVSVESGDAEWKEWIGPHTSKQSSAVSMPSAVLKSRSLAAGASERISFAFEKILKTPNTFLAHRLIWYAAQQGRQDAVVDALFRGYFEQGADIGLPSVLASLAESAGLDAVRVFSRLMKEPRT